MKIMNNLFFMLICFASILMAENYLINGGQESQINYQMVQKVEPVSGTNKLILSYVIPESFSSPTYVQKITAFRIEFSVPPNKREEDVDRRGNKILRATWNRPDRAITSSIQLTALNSTGLQRIKTQAPFPVASVPSAEQAYLGNSEQVPTTNPEIVALAKKLTAKSRTQFDAVQQILTWVV
ncbi:hypothetical protein JXO59_16750, partial [candidate division KSB1 bacterium]|nr:hypothetical protein [candidate division KSB1 bacterium]